MGAVAPAPTTLLGSRLFEKITTTPRVASPTWGILCGLASRLRVAAGEIGWRASVRHRELGFSTLLYTLGYGPGGATATANTISVCAPAFQAPAFQVHRYGEELGGGRADDGPARTRRAAERARPRASGGG